MVMPEGYRPETKQEALARYIHRQLAYTGFATLGDFREHLRNVDMDRQLQMVAAAAYIEHRQLPVVGTFRFMFLMFVMEDDETAMDVADFLLEHGDQYADKLTKICEEIESETPASEEAGS